ncbi:MAG TPA: hypothetical protein VH062_14965 [Polyangiaceae bacterium]|nr:hypothetical protein [Polyangiaceae bacterium]
MSEDDSLHPVTGPDGFASDAIPGRHRAGVPWEKRPLSRHGIVGWTVGTLIGAVAVATTILVVATREPSHVDQVAATHGIETTDVAAAVPAPPVTEGAPAVAAPATEATATPLSALPKADPTPVRPHKKAALHTQKATTALAASKTASTKMKTTPPANASLPKH